MSEKKIKATVSKDIVGDIKPSGLDQLAVRRFMDELETIMCINLHEFYSKNKEYIANLKNEERSKKSKKLAKILKDNRSI